MSGGRQGKYGYFNPAQPSLEIQAKHQSQRIDLSIGSSSGLVLMFVIWLEFVPLAERKDTANTFGSPAPFVKIAVVVSFNPDVGREVIGTQGEGSFCREPVAISPRKFTVDRPQINPVSIRK